MFEKDKKNITYVIEEGLAGVLAVLSVHLLLIDPHPGRHKEGKGQHSNPDNPSEELICSLLLGLTFFFVLYGIKLFRNVLSLHCTTHYILLKPSKYP